ncbi:MAG: VOC family protein [Candidatus Gracilibacteria bacterium]
MARSIFVNLCVKDIEKSKTFYTELGFTINEQFTNESAACIVMADNIFLMILTPEFFQSFTKKTPVDATNNVEVMNAFSAESKEEVEEMYQKALAAGGTEGNAPQDYGFMVSKSFQDLDGHIWEVVYMDPNQVQ